MRKNFTSIFILPLTLIVKKIYLGYNIVVYTNLCFLQLHNYSVDEREKKMLLDDTNHVPKYVQIQNWLQAMIRRGRIKKGDQLPTEEELAKMFSVNRMTVRQAIDSFVMQKMVI